MTTTPKPEATSADAPPAEAPLERRADGSCHDGTAVVDCDSREPIAEVPRDLDPVETTPAEPKTETPPASTGRPDRIDPSTLPKPSGAPGTEIQRRADGICWEISTGQKAHQPKQVQCP